MTVTIPNSYVGSDAIECRIKQRGIKITSFLASPVINGASNTLIVIIYPTSDSGYPCIESLLRFKTACGNPYLERFQSDYCQAFFSFSNGGKPKSFEVNWGLATSTKSHHWFFGRWSMPKSLHHPWSRPHPLLHFSWLGSRRSKRSFLLRDPYVTSVRLSFSPRCFGGYCSEKGRKTIWRNGNLSMWQLVKWRSFCWTWSSEPSFRPDGKGSVKSSRWDEWAQRAKIAPKMLEDAVPFLANKSNHFGSFRPQIWCRYITRMYSMGWS